MRVSSDKRVREAVDMAVRAGCTLTTGGGKAKLRSPSGLRIMLVPITPRRSGNGAENWFHNLKKLMES